MADPTPLKIKGDYSEHVIIKNVDGERIECVNLDALSEDQIGKYCRDTGTKREDFPRWNITV